MYILFQLPGIFNDEFPEGRSKSVSVPKKKNDAACEIIKQDRHKCTYVHN